MMVRHLRGTGSDAMALAPVAAVGLSKSFEPRRGETVPVLRHVDFMAGWGQMTGIVGPSGSGKSTLMYCLAGLESVSDGSVRVLGQEVTRMSRARSARFRRDHLGFVFQSYNLVPSMSVEDNLRLPFTLRGVRFPWDRAAGLLDRLGILGLRSCSPTSRPARWTPSPAGAWSMSCARSRTVPVMRWSWSRTVPRSRPGAIASCGCVTACWPRPVPIRPVLMGRRRSDAWPAA